MFYKLCPCTARLVGFLVKVPAIPDGGEWGCGSTVTNDWCIRA